MNKQFVINIAGTIVNPELWEKDKELYESEIKTYIAQAIRSVEPLEPVHVSSGSPVLIESIEIQIVYEPQGYDAFGFMWDVESSAIIMDDKCLKSI